MPRDALSGALAPPKGRLARRQPWEPRECGVPVAQYVTATLRAHAIIRASEQSVFRLHALKPSRLLLSGGEGMDALNKDRKI